ncbi:unnamed protein product [Triticum turgidum subsp. durum]|uniref:Plant heme peroxidase family profile domain-containing protein n=1 Tax=Triticum turgidum subsp. durum TaxID=4567 RepID=A0A9R1BMT0_TRITD|nr:unnamed protein product [Triticum turgidum subsp. durum]
MLSSLSGAAYGGGMSPGYYKTTCPQLEDIVLKEVTRKKNETIVTIPAVLRLFFHDCLVNVSSSSLRPWIKHLIHVLSLHWTPCTCFIIC